MIGAMIKSAVVLLLAACVTSLMRKQSAAVRHAVWTAGLIGAMAIPLCTLTLPSWQTTISGPVVAWLRQVLSAVSAVQEVAVGVWVGGATVGIAMLLYSATRLAWVAIRSEPVEDERWSRLAEEVRQQLGIRRPVRLLQNRSVPFLGTWGILVPRVLLPADAESWPDDRVRMVLAHELAHIQRHDWVVQVLADAARALYWFNPIFWIASSRLRRESEYACDDAVVRMGTTGTEYAAELLAMTRALRMEQRLQSPILAMAQPSHLEQRLVALLNPSLNRLAATPWAVIVVAAVAIALTLPLAAFRPGAGSEEAAGLAPAATLAISPTDTSAATAEAASAAATSNAPKGSIPSSAVLTMPRSTNETKNERQAAFEPSVLPELQESRPVFIPPAAPVALFEPLRDLSVNAAPPPPPVDANVTAQTPFDCKVTTSTLRAKTSSIAKFALGTGPWLINEDQTIWATDQPFVANSVVNTIWMRPANTELSISARRLDGDAPDVRVGPASPLETPYLGVGIVFPTAGCWEVTGTAGTSSLTFITKVRE